MELDEVLHRAERARQILDDPLVKEALKAIEDGTVYKLRMATDDASRLRLVCFLQVVDLFKQYFVSHMETGKIAADQSRWQKLKETVGL